MQANLVPPELENVAKKISLFVLMINFYKNVSINNKMQKIFLLCTPFY